MMGGATFMSASKDEPILIKSSPNYADGNEIVADVAPIRSNDA